MAHVGRVSLAKKKKARISVNASNTEHEIICTFSPDRYNDIKPFDKNPSPATQKLINVFHIPRIYPESSIGPLNRGLDEIEIRFKTGRNEVTYDNFDNHTDVYVSGSFLNHCSQIVGRSSLRTLRIKVVITDYDRFRMQRTLVSLKLPLEPQLLNSDRKNVTFHTYFEKHQQIFNPVPFPYLFNGKDAIVHMDLTSGTENIGAKHPSLISLDSFREFQNKVLNDQLGTDTTIVLDNGFSIGCHKIFLMGQSPVLEAMLNSAHFEEGKTCTLKLPDMSEYGVKTLLNFLYYLIDDPTAISHIDTVVELLLASEKYKIDRLKNAVFMGLMKKPRHTITAADALQIFFFTRNVQGFEELQAKAVAILKLQCQRVVQMDEYKKLFHEYPKVAMELCNAIFQAQ